MRQGLHGLWARRLRSSPLANQLRGHVWIWLFSACRGGGKGTQGDLLTKRFSYYKISTGELLRQQVKMNTSLGKVAKAHIDAGDLVPDDVIIAFVRQQVSTLAPNTALLFDGFPRTIRQNEALEKMLNSINRRIGGVIYLSAPEEVVVQRMLARGRTDDSEQAIRRRIDGYHNATKQLLEYYGERGLMSEVDGVGTPETVHDRIVASMSLAHSDREV